MTRGVFISYSRTDRSYVDRLAEHLAAAGIEVWYDYAIEAGDTFGPRIQRAIDECAALIVVLTPAAVASKWVTREIGYADSLNRPILPLLLEPCVKPIEVHLVQHEDVTGALLPSPRFTDRVRTLTGTDPVPASPQQPVTPFESGEMTRCVAWSRDGRYLATGGDDQLVRVWAADTGARLHTLSGHENWVLSLAWSTSGRYLFSAGADGKVLEWKLADRRVFQTFDLRRDPRRMAMPGRVWALGVDWSTTHRLATAADDFTAAIWNDHGHLLHLLEGHRGAVTSVAWAPDGRHLATTSTDGSARIWLDHADRDNAPTYRVLEPTQARAVRSAAWSPDGQYLVTAGDEGHAAIWPSDPSGRPTPLAGHEFAIRSVAWSADNRIATADEDGTVRIFDAGSHRLDRTVTGISELAAVAWSPDGRLAIAGANLAVL